MILPNGIFKNYCRIKRSSTWKPVNQYFPIDQCMMLQKLDMGKKMHSECAKNQWILSNNVQKIH